MAKNLRDKPLVSMTPEELDQTFEIIGRPLNRRLLQDARSKREVQATIVAAVLKTPQHPAPVLVHTALEYGDREGTNNIIQFAKEAEPLLRRGEKLEIVLLQATLPIPL